MVLHDEQLIAEEYIKVERENQNKRLLRMEKNKNCHLYEVKENIFTTPIRKYSKFKVKSQYYDQLYRRNTFLYYFYTNLHLGWKLFRKKMLKKTISTIAFAAMMYFFKHTGLSSKLVELVKRFFVWSKNKLSNK